MVGDGHAMGVAARILKERPGATEGTLERTTQFCRWSGRSQAAKALGEPLFRSPGKQSWRLRKACRRAATKLAAKTFRTPASEEVVFAERIERV